MIYPEIYSDFDVTFRKNVMTGDVVRKVLLDDIKQSLGLLLRTRFYDRCWHPEIGSYVQSLLFQQDDDYIKQVIKNQITTLIKNYEPRITIENIEIEHRTKDDAAHGAVTIRIEYIVNNLNTNDVYIYAVTRVR